MKFDLDGIKADGYDVTTPIVVTNANEFTIQTVAEGAVVPRCRPVETGGK